MLEFKFIFGQNGYEVARALRESVFKESDLTEATDSFEHKAEHFVGYDKTTQIASARLLQLSETDFKISYVAVKKEYRGQYVGDLIMRALADKAASLAGNNIILEAPVDIKGFFEFEGYEEYGEEFEIGGRSFVMMRKDLTKIQPCQGCAR